MQHIQEKINHIRRTYEHIIDSVEIGKTITLNIGDIKIDIVDNTVFYKKSVIKFKKLDVAMGYIINELYTNMEDLTVDNYNFSSDYEHLVEYRVKEITMEINGLIVEKNGEYSYCGKNVIPLNNEIIEILINCQDYMTYFMARVKRIVFYFEKFYITYMNENYMLTIQGNDTIIIKNYKDVIKYINEFCIYNGV